MNRASTPMFTAYDLFDPTSTYTQLRAPDPQLTLYQFIHALAAQQRREAERPDLWMNAADTHTVAGLVFQADAPQKMLSVTVNATLYPQPGGPTRLTVRTPALDPSARHGAGLACRALVLTADVIKMLCGPAALVSPAAMREALQQLFMGDAGQDALEAARILSGVPELNGQVTEEGECRFDPYELPENTLDLAGLPPRTAVVVVIEPTVGESS